MQDVDLKGCVRVSDILKRLYDFGDVEQEVLKAKSLIGTNVHKAIVDDCAGEFPVLETDRAQAYFDSYQIWKRKRENSFKTFGLQHNPFDIKQIPRLYCHDLKITGECDGLLNNFNLIDWKCSAMPNKKIWNMQAHFYWYLLDVNGIRISDNMMWINLRHQKKIRQDPNSNIGRIIYTPLDPVVYEFTFDENILSECISEANKYWEEINSAKVLD